MTELRKIRDDERDATLQLWRYAFENWSAEPLPPDRLSWADPDDVFAVVEDGRPVAALKCLHALQSVRGVVKDMGGISCVATAPDHRNRGHASALMKAAFAEMRSARWAASMLLPFRESFYARFGYVSANGDEAVTFPLEALARRFGGRPPTGWTVAATPAPDALDAYAAFMREHVLPRFHGMALKARYSDEGWRARAKEAMVAFATRGGRPAGVMVYRKTGYMDQGRLSVGGIYWDDDDARAALFNFIAGHRGQVAKVEMTVPFGTPFQQWLEDVPEPLEVRVFFLPWMVRVMDVPAAVAGLPAALPGRLEVAVADEHCPWNCGPFTLSAARGALSAAAGGDGRVRMDIRGLSALVYGCLPAAEVARRGWLAGADAVAFELLAGWFPPLPLFNTFHF